MTKPQPQGDSPNRKRDLVTTFLHDYSDALAEAKVSEAHTATDGWQRLYAGWLATDQTQRRRVAGYLRDLADRLEDVGLGDDDLLNLRDAKKEITELKEAAALFRLQTVEPVRKPATVCAALKEHFAAQARRQEAENPLLEAGLAEVMREAIAGQPRVTWDEERGTVSITA